MTKTKTPRTVAAFTNYFMSVQPITVLRFDGNKYTRITKADGTEDEIKAGYIFANADCTRRLSGLTWHTLEGRRRETYHPRKRKTTYALDDSSGEQRKFSSKASAVHAGFCLANATGQEVDIMQITKTTRSSRYAGQELICVPRIGVVQRTPSLVNKWLRGKGKAAAGLKNPRFR